MQDYIQLSRLPRYILVFQYKDLRNVLSQDFFDFLELKKNHGKEEMRARDLFYAMWTPDLFMKRVEDDGEWTLMCPNECPGLYDVHGEEFEKLYKKYWRGSSNRSNYVYHFIDNRKKLC